MTDRIDHYAESESLAATAGIRDSVDRMYATKTDIYLAAIHKSLLAIHDTLTAADRYATNEAKQRDDEPDPLDEDDHRDRVTATGHILQRHGWGHWHSEEGSGVRCSHRPCVGVLTLSGWENLYGPLAFAPEPPPDGAGDDLSAPEGESGAEEREGADDAPEALLCPECGHDLEDHCEYCCGCPRSPSGVAYTLLADAVKAEREAGTDG